MPTRRTFLFQSGAGLLLGLGLAPAACAQRRPAPGRTIDPERFRAPGESDDQALAKFWAALGNGVNGQLSRDYEVRDQQRIDGKRDFALNGAGHAIRMAAGVAVAGDKSVLKISHSSDFRLEDLVLDGRRAARPATAGHVSAHGLWINQCSRWTTRRVGAVDCPMDGFLVGAEMTSAGPRADQIPQDWVMEECTADNSWRNGLSIIDSFNARILGGRYSNSNGSIETGLGGPAAGIDIEPDRRDGWIADRVRNILLDRVTFDGNRGFNLLVTNVQGVHGVVARNCRFLNNGLGALSISAEGTRIINPYIEGWDDRPSVAPARAPMPKRGLIDIPANAGQSIVIDHPVFRRVRGRSRTQFLVYVHSTAAGAATVIAPDVARDIATTFTHPASPLRVSH